MDVVLTRDAQNLLKELYSAYCDRVADGISKQDASMFDGAQYISENVYGDMSIDGITFSCQELGRAGMLNNLYASSVLTACSLTPKGISYMETRFKRTAKSLVEIISSLKP